MASLAALLSVLDFALFELNQHAEHDSLVEWTLAKPSFFSHSYFSWHILSFVLVAMGLFFFLKSLKFFLSRISSALQDISAMQVWLLLFPIFLIFIRLKRFSQQPTIVSIYIITTLVTSLIFLKFFERIDSGYIGSKCGTLLPKQRKILYFLFICYLLIFFAPNIFIIYLQLRPRPTTTSPTSPNVILFVLDTVRSDRLAHQGYPKQLTPHLDEIAGESLIFRSAYSTAPWTLPSHASMFTGLLPSRHGADWENLHLTPDHITLAEILRDSGYRTAGFSENPMVSQSTGLAQGFSMFHEPWRGPLFARVLRQLNDKLGLRNDQLEYADHTLGLVRNWIKQGQRRDQSFFAFINLMSAHLPRYPRPLPGEENWSRRDLKKIEPVNRVAERYYLGAYRLDALDLRVMEGIYDQQIRYLDSKLGDFVTFLRNEKLLQNTVLIITSDHGELFGEHGFFEHQLNLYGPVLHVPFILRYPRMLPHRVEEHPVSISSIFSTVLEIAGAADGVSKENRPLVSRSVLESGHPDAPVVSEYANGVGSMKRAIGHEAPNFDFSPFDRRIKSVVFGKYKYIWYSTGQEELFDIMSDPSETEDLSAARSDVVLRLRQILGVNSVDFEVPEVPDSPALIDPATRDALKALGYE